MAVVVAGLALFVGILALGGWQVQRLAWKTHLIAQVDARVHAAAVPAPGPTQWAGVTRDRDQYRRVTVRGRFLHGKETLVQAVTDAGGGFWVMTPLVDDRGFTVLINRGFVPSGRRDPAVRADGQVEGPQTVTGLLRITEPKGGFLRSNDPAAGRWYSRGVAAIAALADNDFVEHSRVHNAKWRQWFADEIASMGNKGVRAVPSKANFQLVLFEGENMIALASEEMAIRAIIDHEIDTYDPYEGEVMVWTR